MAKAKIIRPRDFEHLPHIKHRRSEKSGLVHHVLNSAYYVDKISLKLRQTCHRQDIIIREN